jgi:hypothetical protein
MDNKNSFPAIVRDMETELPQNPAELADWFRAWKRAQAVGRKIEAAIRKEIEETGRCGGLIFREKAGSREIADPAKAFGLLRDTLTANDFLAACKVSVPTLEKTFVERRALYDENGKVKAGESARCKALFAATVEEVMQEGTPRREIVEAPEDIIL